MRTVLVILAVVVGVLAATFAYVGWRDRRRLTSDDDPAVVRAARAEQHRRETERHHPESDGWNRDDPGGHGFTG